MPNDEGPFTIRVNSTVSSSGTGVSVMLNGKVYSTHDTGNPKKDLRQAKREAKKMNKEAGKSK